MSVAFYKENMDIKANDPAVWSSTRARHKAAARASLWLLLLALAVVTAIGSLTVSRSMLAAIHE